MVFYALFAILYGTYYGHHYLLRPVGLFLVACSIYRSCRRY